MIKLQKETKSLWQRTTFDCWSNWSWDKNDVCFNILDFGYENYVERRVYLQILNFVIEITVVEEK